MMKIPVVMSNKLCKEIKIECIIAKLNSKEKTRECRRKNNNIEFQEIRYLEKYIAKCSLYSYKLGIRKPILFYDNLPYSTKFHNQ